LVRVSSSPGARRDGFTDGNFHCLPSFGYRWSSFFRSSFFPHQKKIMANALLLGCTGLVGNEILTQLLLDREFDKVIVLVRQPLPFTHPKLE
jgi:hypothetical protein